VTPLARRIMQQVRGADTIPEIVVRRALHAQGYRFRLHDTRLPGRPDIVLPSRRMIVFVHGCFWHRHPGCRYASTPKTRTDFWETKFRANVDRDERVRAQLLERGWNVQVIWECEIKRGTYLAPLLTSLEQQSTALGIAIPRRERNPSGA
jgi:DNA mismatch endonuclease (patch repair protein)